MSFKNIPIVGIGPGSQPQEQDALDYMPIPAYMDSYRSPVLAEDTSLRAFGDAYRVLNELAQHLREYRVGTPARQLDVTSLSAPDREMVDQILGEGEVSVLIDGPAPCRIQESILTGVWRLQELDDDGTLIRDIIEVGQIPQRTLDALIKCTRCTAATPTAEYPDGVINAPSLLVEIEDGAYRYRAGDPAHVINFTLMPTSPQDMNFLEQSLGVGPVTVLSRGFGNCRITSTGVRNAWWVRYYNSMDTLILNTLEIVDLPAVACAAQEDIDDNVQRLCEIMEIFQ